MDLVPSEPNASSAKPTMAAVSLGNVVSDVLPASLVRTVAAPATASAAPAAEMEAHTSTEASAGALPDGAVSLTPVPIEAPQSELQLPAALGGGVEATEVEVEDGNTGMLSDDAPPTPKRRKSQAAGGDITIPKGSVKRVIKLDKDVRLVSAEAVLAISKATEFFLEHLSVKAHEHSLQDTEDAGTIKYDNVVKAQTEDPSCDFLNDLFKYWNPTQDAPVDEQQMATSTATAAAAMDGLGGAVI